MVSVTRAVHPAGSTNASPTAFRPELDAIARTSRIPTSFQLFVGLYILLTGSIPPIIQASVFGLQGGGGDAFAIAMASRMAFDLLLIAPVIFLSGHPLGILHPLIMAVVAWPLVLVMPSVVAEVGGWAGVLAGLPVDTPYFTGLPGRAPSTIWLAIAKVNGIKALGLLCAYAGFYFSSGGLTVPKSRGGLRNPVAVRAIMICLITLSAIVMIFFLRQRGGINAHLTSLGGGRFKELSQYGMVIVAIQMGAIALWIWIAAMPRDIKSPLFLSFMALVVAQVFISNGARSTALAVPLTSGLIWALRTRRIPWKIALLLIPLMFMAIGVLGTVRTSSWSRSTAAQEFSKTDWSKSFATTQKEVAQRVADSADVPIAERGFALTNGPMLGRSYLSALLAFIPRSLWHDKPRGMGSIYAQLFLGASFEGWAVPVSAEIEMYWNFGLVGVVVLSFIHGLLIRKCYNFYWRNFSSPFVTVFYTLFITSFQFSTNFLSPFQQRTFLLLLCYALVSMLVQRVSPANLAPSRVPARRPSSPILSHE